MKAARNGLQGGGRVGCKNRNLSKRIKRGKVFFPILDLFFKFSELYCQIWLNLLMDDYHFKYITKLEKQKENKI
jgi:hypothetical protein